MGTPQQMVTPKVANLIKPFTEFVSNRLTSLIMRFVKIFFSIFWEWILIAKMKGKGQTRKLYSGPNLHGPFSKMADFD